MAYMLVWQTNRYVPVEVEAGDVLNKGDLCSKAGRESAGGILLSIEPLHILPDDTCHKNHG